jgi:hypothetical protein
MKQLARGSLIVALLLTSFGAASAACAWVLWVEHGDPRSKEWHWLVAEAHETKSACDKSAQWMQERWKEKVVQDAARGPIAPGAGEVRYFCVPDTIDPRGPKGK